MFIDEVRVHVRGGKGGGGVTSFARQPYEPRGRPEGGDGGRGGDVIVRATATVATLVEYHHRPHRKAESGRNGEGDLRAGADGADEVLLVPIGTVVRDDDGAVLADLIEDGDAIVVAEGGRGGRGNAAFRTSARRAPTFHEHGERAEERTIRLELKLMADVALVGFPSAGKSSLVARLSAARPKIADYPFTTLTPNLGVVVHGDSSFVVADVPGLIEGAAEGRGLGLRFLRHVERAKVLVHVLDCASHEQRDPREDLAVVLGELARYETEVMAEPGALTRRNALIVLNKVDADAEVAEIVRPDLEGAGWDVIESSAVTGTGLGRLRRDLAARVEKARAAEAPAVSTRQRPVLRPVDEADDITIDRVPDGWRVRGARPERWVQMTDLDNAEGVRHLQGRLERAGVERDLAAAGARRGDDIEIAGTVFSFDPDDSALPPDHPDRRDRDGRDGAGRADEPTVEG